MMELLPIKRTLEENADFASNPRCSETLLQCIEYYTIIGFHPPWICYYASVNGELVGNAAYKGRPVNNQVEIAYGTFPEFQNKGIGSLICRKLVEQALDIDNRLIITARTLAQENFSTRILRKNNFMYSQAVVDPDDGEVWEWVYRKP